MRVFEKYYEVQQYHSEMTDMCPTLYEGITWQAIKTGTKAVWNFIVEVVKSFIQKIKAVWNTLSLILDFLTKAKWVISAVVALCWGEYVTKNGESLIGVNMWNSKTGEHIRVNYKGNASPLDGWVHSVDYWDAHNSNLLKPTKTVFVKGRYSLAELAPMLREFLGTVDNIPNIRIHKAKIEDNNINDILDIRSGTPSETSTTAALRSAVKMDNIYEIPDRHEKTNTILKELNLINGRDDEEAIDEYLNKNRKAQIEDVTMFAVLRNSGMEDREASNLTNRII